MSQLTNLWFSVAGLESRAARRRLERRLAITALGAVQALRQSELSLAAAREDIFNLDTYLQVKKLQLSPKLRELFEWAMELENVVSINSMAYSHSLNKIEELAKEVVGARHESHKVKARTPHIPMAIRRLK